MKTIDDFLTSADTDISVAMSAKVRNKYCFVIQPPSRWGKTADGRPVLFFGGVGGKVEQNEGLAEALRREAQEEIGCDIEILIKADVGDLPLVNRENIGFEKVTATTQTPLPWCIFQNKRSELGRKSMTNVFI